MKGVRKFEGCLFADPEPERRFYLYRHVRNDNGDVFYVGRGTGNRYTSTFGRNVFWHRIVDKSGGFKAERFLMNLTASEAVEKEREFVGIYGRRDRRSGTLTNLTDGGEGMISYTPSEETRQKLRNAKRSKPTRYWSGKSRPEFIGDKNIKSRSVVCKRTGRRFPTVTAMHEYLFNTGMTDRKRSSVSAWLTGQNRRPEWFSFEYETNLTNS